MWFIDDLKPLFSSVHAANKKHVLVLQIVYYRIERAGMRTYTINKRLGTITNMKVASQS